MAFPVVAVALLSMVACGSAKATGTPSCSATSMPGKRLAHGCRHDGKVYQPKIERCTDGTVLYNVPFTPDAGGSSGYSNGKIRARAITIEELEHCLGQ